MYLAFEVLENGTFSFSVNNIDYSLDDGSTWTTLTAGSSTPTISTGSKVMWRAINPTISSTTGIGTFSSTGTFNIEGNTMSLLYGDDFNGKTDLTGKDRVFVDLFYNCKTLIDASKLILPATILSERCYQEMFKGCNSLVTAPKLPATTLANYCYNTMFQGCRSLVNAPELPATTLVAQCYITMFASCRKLNYIKMMATDISAHSCLEGWVSGVSSTGTFIKHPNMTTLPSSVSGIPEGWTVEDAIV